MVNIPTSWWPPVHRFLRLTGAWAAVLYAGISGIQSTSWGAKNTVLAAIGAALLYAEHNNATPNASSDGSSPPSLT